MTRDGLVEMYLVDTTVQLGGGKCEMLVQGM